MSDKNEHKVGPEAAISLAETFLENHRQKLSSNLGQAIEDEIEQWEQRKASVNEGDDLYELAQERIEQNRAKLEQLENETENVERQLLTVVAQGFTAKGKWLDSSLLRALNLILFNKYSNSFVIKRRVLDENTTLADEDLYAVSQAVRNLAREQLDEH